MQYAVAGQVKGGVIRLRGRLKDDIVHLSVSDSGQKETKINLVDIKKGVGLQNTEARMKAHYRGNGDVHYAVSDMGGLEVSLSFRYVTAANFPAENI